MKINQVINIKTWQKRDMQVGFGTRDKIVLKQSKMGKVYFMAKSYDKDLGELRSEVCASNMGRLFGFPVQKTWFCEIPQYKEVKLKPLGVLIQLDVRRQRYATRNEFRENLIHGAALISNINKNFSSAPEERDRRNLYTLDIVVEAIRQYVKKTLNSDKIWEQFFELICFDALIGGTDRHYNNWGVLEKAEDSSFLRLSPAFDNGISLLWKLEKYKSSFMKNIITGEFPKKAQAMFKKKDGGKFTLYEVVRELYLLPEFKGSSMARVIIDRLIGASDGALMSCLFNNVPKRKEFKTGGDELKWIYEYVKIRKRILIETLSRLI